MTGSPPTPLDFRSIPDGREVVIRNTVAKVERTFLPIGSLVGKYRVLSEIDRGGMAVVYKALQLDLDREVALKVIPATISINARLLDRFLSEAHAVSRLDHPNIVRIHEISTEDNIYFIAMDYIPGTNLSDYLHAHKPKLVEVLDIVAQLTDALAYAHRQKIIHRDLKLNNVIMKNNETPVLIDFGLAKALEEEGASSITRTGELVGSPAYMAPERILGGAVDNRSDVCSLGIMLYEMLTFKNPYLDQRSVHQTTMNVIEANPVPPRKLVSWLPTEVEAITLKAMHGDPVRRYRRMEEFHDDVLRYQHGEFVLAQPPSLFSRFQHFMRRNWPYVVISLITGLFAILFGVTSYVQSQRGKSHWQLLHLERFNNREFGGLWTENPRPSAVTDAEQRWSVVDGALETLPSARESWIRFEKALTRDVRIECDVMACGDNLRDIGIFLYGAHPDSAYRFWLYRGVEAAHGIMPPGSDLLVHQYNPLDFPASRRHHVEIERRQRLLSMRVDGVLVARWWDHFPRLGRGYQRMGFFAASEGGRFDNLRILQMAMPLSAGPTLVADRFWERGDFTAALDEYTALTIDYSDLEIARHVQLRIPDCLIRLGRYQDALLHLERGSVLRFGTNEAQAEAVYLMGVANQRIGATPQARELFASVCTDFPNTAVGHSAAAALVLQMSRTLESGAVDTVSRLLDSLAPRLQRYHELLSGVHFSTIDTLKERERVSAAIRTADRMLTLYGRDAAIATKIMVERAYLSLCKREPKTAVDILNRCVATHVYSEGVWEAWMLLASVYEHDAEYGDAVTIYRKVFRECPSGSRLRWMARIKIGELSAKVRHDESAESVFRDVVASSHPFALPRAIASLYLGQFGETQFTDLWHSYYPEDWSFLYYLARKAILDGEQVIADIYLRQLLQSLSPSSWEYLQIYQMITNLDEL